MQLGVVTQYEEDVGTTSWRHTNTGGPDGPHLDALRKLDFVIRSVSTIGNYGGFSLGNKVYLNNFEGVSFSAGHKQVLKFEIGYEGVALAGGCKLDCVRNTAAYCHLPACLSAPHQLVGVLPVPCKS